MKLTKPKGILIPIGGAEDKENNKEILARIIKETKKAHPTVCIVTLASTFVEETFKGYVTAFKALGHTKVTHVHYQNHNEGNEEKHLQIIKACDAVIFSGGYQLRLTTLLGGTKLFEAIRTRYYDEPGFVIAGTSAGAAAMSDTMIVSGSSCEAMIKGELELTNGLDLINNVFIDTHFTERGRVGRIIQTVTCNPGVLGIGLGEDTAIVIKKEELEVVGSGLVMIIDGTLISYTDLAEKQDGEPITVEGVKVHVLGHSSRFSIKDRKMIVPVRKIK
jgi:cyanophycinase